LSIVAKIMANVVADVMPRVSVVAEQEHAGDEKEAGYRDRHEYCHRTALPCQSSAMRSTTPDVSDYTPCRADFQVKPSSISNASVLS
jgi:hypothetical protein